MTKINNKLINIICGTHNEPNFPCLLTIIFHTQLKNTFSQISSSEKQVCSVFSQKYFFFYEEIKHATKLKIASLEQKIKSDKIHI